MPPRVHILGTGGSISGIGPHRLDYTLYPEAGKKLTAEQMLERIPEARELAELTGEDVLQVGSPSIGPKEWLQLSNRVHALLGPDGVKGIVVTHGTATLEETAYFLHLTVKSDRPVVVTGAMRPPSAIGTDADLNLLDAIRLAATPEAAGRGVLTILNNEIQSARDVTKSNAFRVDTFDSRDFGVLGYVDSDARVLFYRAVTRPHTTATPFDVRGRNELPRVDIVYSYAGADGVLVDALTERRPNGMVLVGFGGGSYPGAFLEAGKRAVQAGIPVVLATRSWNGRVVITPKKDADGFIVCDDLMPQKARILLMLALTVTRERKAIQDMFHKY
ncbi:MAG TPA: asparaginase [Burkholderiales bacterium]|jgi:L-asparaginase|nr:asparaginase [Burkholderiales bacterium]